MSLTTTTEKGAEVVNLIGNMFGCLPKLNILQFYLFGLKNITAEMIKEIWKRIKETSNFNRNKNLSGRLRDNQ